MQGKNGGYLQLVLLRDEFLPVVEPLVPVHLPHHRDNGQCHRLSTTTIILQMLDISRRLQLKYQLRLQLADVYAGLSCGQWNSAQLSTSSTAFHLLCTHTGLAVR